MKHSDSTDLQPLDGPRLGTTEALAKALEFPEVAVKRLLDTLIGRAVKELVAGRELHITGFGHFQPRPFRQHGPSRDRWHYGWDPAEVPYPGPVDFSPAAALLRQLDEGQARPQVVYNCDPLLTALQEEAGVPRVGAAQVLQLVISTFAELLLAQRSLGLPGLGTLLVVSRPGKVKYDPAEKTLKGSLTFHVHFYASPELLAKLPDNTTALTWIQETKQSPPGQALLGSELDEEKFEP